MSMTVGGDESDEEEVTSSINTTPLVDVMLVLLIIFLITVPVVTHTVKVKLPSETNQATKTRPENINISVTSAANDPLQDGEAHWYWNGKLVPDMNQLLVKMEAAAQSKPGGEQPSVLIKGDQDAPYEAVGKVVYAAQLAGIEKVGFILQPPLRGGQ